MDEVLRDLHIVRSILTAAQQLDPAQQPQTVIHCVEDALRHLSRVLAALEADAVPRPRERRPAEADRLSAALANGGGRVP